MLWLLTPSISPLAGRVVATMTDEQLFLQFWDKAYASALEFGVDVKRADIDYYICWGPEEWVHRFDPDRARREGVDAQAYEAAEKIRANR